MDTLNPASGLEKAIVYKATMTNTPISGAFELLPLCNLNCRMCYLRKSAALCKDYSSLLPFDFWMKIAEDLSKAGTLFLLLTGGEPFLYPEFDKLYLELRKMGFILTLNTNGTLITKEKAQFLAENQPRRVNVTLYGTSGKTYKKVTGSESAFEKTIEGIKNLLEVGIQVKMNVSLIPDNVDELEDFYRIAGELGIPLEVNSYMYPATRENGEVYEGLRLDPIKAAEADFLDRRLQVNDDEIWIALLKNMKECYANHLKAVDLKVNDTDSSEKEVLPCRAGNSSFWINWKGELTPCVFLDQGSANLNDMSFSDGWAQIIEYRKKVFLPKKCSSCDMRKFCLICGAAAYHDGANLFEAPAYLCEMTEEKLRLADIYKIKE